MVDYFTKLNFIDNIYCGQELYAQTMIVIIIMTPKIMTTTKHNCIDSLWLLLNEPKNCELDPKSIFY